VPSAIRASDEPGSVLPERFGGEADRKTVRVRARAIDPGDQPTCDAVVPPKARPAPFLAIDRATRRAFIRIVKDRTAVNARPAPSGLNPFATMARPP
jgi:hypothetical protein